MLKTAQQISVSDEVGARLARMKERANISYTELLNVLAEPENMTGAYLRAIEDVELLAKCQVTQIQQLDGFLRRTAELKAMWREATGKVKA